MGEACPVCGDPYEYVDDRRGDPGAVIDVEELCGVDADRRWDRICVRAVADGGGPAVEEYRHHWAEE
jgi:hypothetical protein